MTSQSRLLTSLRAFPVLPVLREASADSAFEVATRLLSAGLPHVELTATTPGWADVLERIVSRYPEAVVGVGTIPDAAAVEQAVSLGATFLVTPWLASDVRAAADAAGIVLIEGGFTPTEVRQAARAGIAKVFAAHVGGPAYITTLRSVLPGAMLLPTGGVRLADAQQWLDAGAIAIGVGSDLAKHPDIPMMVKVIAELRPPGSSLRD